MVLVALLGLALPAWVRYQGEKMASQMLGRTVHIGHVAFTPWTLQWQLDHLTIAAAQGDDPQFSIERIRIDMAWQSLWHLAPVLDALQIERPVLRLQRTSAGHYDVDDLLQRLALHTDASTTARAPLDSSEEPLRFALYNVALSEGAIHFVDAAHAGTPGTPRTHTVRHITLNLPFLSSLPSQRAIQVQPRLAWEMDGSTFDSSAQTTPFLSSHATQARITLANFDVSPYLDYLPAGLPLRVQSGIVDVDMALSFTQPQTPPTAAATLQLQGTLHARNMRITDAQARPFLELARLKMDIADLQPLARQGRIRHVEIETPHWWVQRERDGRLRWEHWADNASAPENQKTPSTPSAQWHWVLERLTLRHSTIYWRDEAAAAVNSSNSGSEYAALMLRDGFFNIQDIAWPLDKKLTFTGHAHIVSAQASSSASSSNSASNSASLALQGQADLHSGSVAATIRHVPLDWANPYLAPYFVPHVQGQLGVDVGFAWHDAARVVHVADLTVEDIALTCPTPASAPTTCAETTHAGRTARAGRGNLAEIKTLRIEQARVDLAHQRIHIARVALTQPRTLLARDSQGRWTASQWVRPQPSPPDTPAASTASTAPPPSPWALHMDALEVDAGAIALHDAQPATPVALQMSHLRVRLTDFAPLNRAPTKASTLLLSARVGAGEIQSGQLEYSGTLDLHPSVAARGQLHASTLPLHVLEPYIASDLNVQLLRADASFNGALAFSDHPNGPNVRIQGDAALDDVRVRSNRLTTRAGISGTPAAGASSAWTGDTQEEEHNDDLLRWKSLGMRGLHVQLAAGHAPEVEVPETVLSDFFTRLILQDNGRINLQDVFKRPATAASAASTASTHPPSAQSTPAADATAAAPAPIVRFGPISVTGGVVHFSDYFIQPNYSADLSALTGKIGGFSSANDSTSPSPVALAELQLRGRAQGTALLEISGHINPLAQPVVLDIVGKMHDLELPPLSPYTIKYTGHGIERGKLSMDVAYSVAPDGQLTAHNKLVLNQLVFSDPVEGAPTSLPVRLASALLSDRNGTIDIDIPINGSLNDPEFRLGPIVFKLMGQLIMKAVTAPFALLAHALGGSSGDDLERITFAPGHAQLDEAQQHKLHKVAQILHERPAVHITIEAHASLEHEREGWKNARLHEQLLEHKRRIATRNGHDPQQILSVTEAETPALIKEVYRQADIPKPRNLLGLLKDIALADMHTLLLTHMNVPEHAMHRLAVARASAIRDYLTQHHHVAPQRLVLGAVNTQPSTAPHDRAPDWQAQAQLKLSVSEP